MFKIEIGQELEFIEPAHVDDRVIDKGTRVQVGHIMMELTEPKITIVILGRRLPETLSVDRHVLTLHCRPVQNPR